LVAHPPWPGIYATFVSHLQQQQHDQARLHFHLPNIYTALVSHLQQVWQQQAWQQQQG
jgi:hypothetical protein